LLVGYSSLVERRAGMKAEWDILAVGSAIGSAVRKSQIVQQFMGLFW